MRSEGCWGRARRRIRRAGGRGGRMLKQRAREKKRRLSTARKGDHALQLTTPRAVRNALVYTLQNARKHGAWRAFAPDVFSSAAFFDGWNCPVRKGAHPRPGLLERARTWLLSVGWRRHGLIDPFEVPVGAEVWMLSVPR